MRRRPILLLSLCLLPGSALGQTASYKSLEATAGAQSQIDYYATGRKDCASAPPPTVKVIKPPKHGILTIKRGTVTTNKIANCPNLQTPANVLFYTGSAGYAGDDEIIYEVTDAKGEVALYNIRITVKIGDKTGEDRQSRQQGQPL